VKGYLQISMAAQDIAKTAIITPVQGKVHKHVHLQPAEKPVPHRRFALPWVMLGIRASFREDSEFSPAEAVFGS
jgi:hypothetical protein